MPVAPSTIVSRASVAVGATSAMRPARPASTSAWVNSAPVRVFPKPRPASTSQIVQSRGGGSCEGRARKRQSVASASRSLGLSSSSSAVCSALGSDASKAAKESFQGIGAFHPHRLLGHPDAVIGQHADQRGVPGGGPLADALLHGGVGDRLAAKELELFPRAPATSLFPAACTGIAAHKWAAADALLLGGHGSGSRQECAEAP